MVGGEVIGIARSAESTLLNVIDQDYGTTCAIRIIERRRDSGAPITIGLGDAIWWQGQDAMWTPKDLTERDIHLPRIGFSH